MHCYCANYYSAVNCHNKVSQFGERCKLCTVMNEGTSAHYQTTRAFQDYYGSASSMDSSRDRDDHRGRARERKSKDAKKSRHQS